MGLRNYVEVNGMGEVEWKEMGSWMMVMAMALLMVVGLNGREIKEVLEI